MDLDIGDKPILRDIDLAVGHGQTLALVGESGSGKTMCCMAALGLIPGDGRLTAGQIDGPDGVWLRTGHGDTVPIPRGSKVTMVFQEPMTSLNPTMRCGAQVAEVVMRHQGLVRAAADSHVLRLFEEVHMPDPERAYSAYPHELSGGQKQRVLIAMALANDPEILLADEPTTALDSTLRAELLDLIAAIQRARGLALVLVTHDMDVVERAADHVAVLLEGRVVEYGSVHQVLGPRSTPTRKVSLHAGCHARAGRRHFRYSPISWTQTQEALQLSKEKCCRFPKAVPSSSKSRAPARPIQATGLPLWRT